MVKERKQIVKSLEWYQRAPWMSTWGYLRHLVVSVMFMYPRARKYGVRYYLDKKFRRTIKNRELSAKRRQQYGSGFLVNKQNFKTRLIIRDGCRCNTCKWTFVRNKLTIDHITPVSKGGRSVMSNLQLLCVPCHEDKSRSEITIPESPFADAFARMRSNV